ncbi:unnamed protein product, partial [Ixodes hexagonus]
EDDCKADVNIQPVLRKTADPVSAGQDAQVLSPVEPGLASPSEERHEKSRTPDSEDLMSSDEGSFPSLLLRRLPPDGHEFPTAYSEPSLVPKDPSSDDAQLKKPVHVYEDSGIFSDDPLSSLSASEGEEKTKVAVTKSNKESRQGDGRAVAEVVPTDGASSDERETGSPAATSPVGDTAEPAKEDGAHPTTFASTPLPIPLPQYCSPLMPDRRASAEATQKRYSGMLASMLETTKFGTKLKGLVIPDKPKASATVAKTMPVIVSNPIPASNTVVLLEDAKPRRDCKLSPPPRQTTLLADPPWKTKETSDVPKYSPAFKRRSLQVSKSLDGPSLRTGAQNGFQFSLTHSKPVTPILPETPVMSPPPLSYTSSGTRSRSNSSSSTFSNPSSSGCSLETTRKSRLEAFGVTDVDQNQPVITAIESSVTNGTSYTQSPLLERYLSSSSYDNKPAGDRVSRQGSVKSTSSSDARTEQKSFTNGDVPSTKYARQRKNSAEVKRLGSFGSTDSLKKATSTVTTSSSPPQPTRSPNSETKCDESSKSLKTWEVTPLKDSKKKFRSMDDRSWNSQFRRHSSDQPSYSVRVSSSSSLNIDQKSKSLDSKESPSEAWQKSVRASQLGQQKTVLKKTIDSADSAKSFKALAQKWEQRSQDSQVNFAHPLKKDTTAAVNGKSPAAISPTAQRHHASANGRATGSSSPDVGPVQLRSPRSPISRPSSMYEERDKPRLSPEWTEPPASSYLRSKPVERPVSVAYRSTKNCSSSLSVNDIKKAFESEVAKVPPRTLASLRVMRSEQQLPLPEHRRFSSIDSNDSGNSTASREQYSSMTSLASTSSLISPQELQQLIDEANQSLDEAGASGHDIHVVILHKDSPTSGLGVTLAGGSDYETKEITVHKVIAGGLADRDGRIRKSDRILSINGKTMKNVTHKDAIDILKSPRMEVVLVLSRDGRQSVRTTPNISRASSLSSVLDVVDEPEVAPTTAAEVQQAPTPTKQEKIVLVKDGLGLGFTLEGGKDSPLGDKPLVIKRIFRGGAAERDGRLQVGSELISINGQVVSSMTRTEAWNFLKKLPDGPLTLLVSGRAS